MVLLKKVYLLWVYVGVLLAGFLLCIVFFRANIDERWIDPTTWSAESRVLLPAETKMLKVSNQVGEVQSNGMQNFKFETEYCYLYEIESTDETATLKCSLLPYYYAIRQKEVPKDWKEKADISIVIKSTDVQPSEFLGRIDKSFKSIRALGSSTYAISLQLQGV